MITNSVYPIASIITSEMSRKKVRVSIVWGQVYGDPTIRLLSWKQIDFESNRYKSEDGSRILTASYWTLGSCRRIASTHRHANHD